MGGGDHGLRGLRQAQEPPALLTGAQHPAQHRSVSLNHPCGRPPAACLTEGAAPAALQTQDGPAVTPPTRPGREQAQDLGAGGWAPAPWDRTSE